MDDEVRELLTKLAVEKIKDEIGQEPMTRSNVMKKVFISFAIEDKFARDNLVFQAKQDHTPFEFMDMSVKEPWSEEWKTRCRSRIKGCDGVIAFISKNTPNASGACWEIKCAKEEGIPIRGFWVYKDDQRGKPDELGSTSVVLWTWENVTNFINS